MPQKSKKFVDAYGRQIWDSFKREPQNEIVERDDGLIFVGNYGAKVYFSKYESWKPMEKRAMQRAKGRVLDVGCGAGRHSLYLQKKGHDVTGIDNSPLAIKVCRERGLKKAKVLSVDGIGKFKPDSFDTVIMMGNNFGLFGSFKKAKSLLKKLYKITSLKAEIIAETRNPYKTKDPDHLAYHKFNRKRGRMAGQVRIRIRHRKLKGTWFDYLMVSPQELKAILKSTGWKLNKIIGPENAQYIAVIGKVQ